MKKRKHSGEITEEEIAFKRKCPFLMEPFDYCYCKKMDSLNVKNVILYCGGNFEECDIYKNTMKSDIGKINSSNKKKH